MQPNRFIGLGLGLVVGMLGLSSCGQLAEEAQFRLLDKEHTGLEFENILRATSDFNVFNYMYFFNGGGVAAGDFNQDGWVDLYFTNNMGPNKLFLNEKGLRFRDVTEEAGLSGMEGWTAGVTTVDINNDGLLDIYVSQMGAYQNIRGRNQLYVCQEIREGVPVFRDEAPGYGLDLVGFSTQATFFDYDLDGDLDLFQLNHSLQPSETINPRESYKGTQHSLAGDKLLRNDGARFTDVTQIAGINSTVIGYGLGVAVADVNLDGWPDMYIGNDFHENDYLYINQQNGTFREALPEYMMHTSRFSMGVDMADINNDGWSEIISLDMLPEDPFIRKSSLSEDDYDLTQLKLRSGYHHQYARNNLQLNNGDGTFSEIGLYAGVEATDWSWAPLFFDFDHDGFKDLFVSNGINRRMNDIDYINFQGDGELRRKSDANELDKTDLLLVEQMPKIKLPNKFFRNTGALRFHDSGKQILNDKPTFSSGAVYADLDNDGDLDVVVNNIEDEPFLYENLTIDRKQSRGNFIAFNFEGSPKNRHGIGATVVLYKGTERLIQQNFPTRGYQSSMPIGLHLGVGDTTAVDSILVIWPQQGYQTFTDLSFNTNHTISWEENLPRFDFRQLSQPTASSFEWEEVAQEMGLDFQHQENPFVEFDREPLIPHMLSAEGPAIAVGDCNGDGLDDVFLGNAKREHAQLFIQSSTGTFEAWPQLALWQDSLYEDVDALWVDIDQDNDQDLVVASGGNEFWDQHEALEPRLYLNDGTGQLERVPNAFPDAYLTAACILPIDFNQDGLMDLFFGARAEPWNYGLSPRSYLFQNLGDLQFVDVTEQQGEGLIEPGLVKNGEVIDIDLDGDEDIILAIEWEPIQLFLNDGGYFKGRAINDRSGWWNTVLPYDFDQDGDLDILATNLGENSKLKPTKSRPLRLYVNDYDENGQVEQVLTHFMVREEVPFATYRELSQQLVSLKKTYLFAQDFAGADLEELFSAEKLNEAILLEANTLQSMYFENTGGLRFKAQSLSARLQFSSLQAAALYDVDRNGQPEVIIGGNFYEANSEQGRYDANFGNVLSWAEDQWQVAPLGNLRIKGQVRRIVPITIGGEACLILGKNNDKLQVIKANFEETH